jgi:hypothetical protein
MALKSSFLFLLTSFSTVTCHVVRSQRIARSETPRLPYDSNTSKYCSYWIDNTDKSLLCTQVPPQWDIPMSSFLRWVYLQTSPSEGDLTDFRSAESLIGSKLQQLHCRSQLLRRSDRRTGSNTPNPNPNANHFHYSSFAHQFRQRHRHTPTHSASHGKQLRRILLRPTRYQLRRNCICPRDFRHAIPRLESFGRKYLRRSLGQCIRLCIYHRTHAHASSLSYTNTNQAIQRHYNSHTHAAQHGE